MLNRNRYIYVYVCMHINVFVSTCIYVKMNMYILMNVLSCLRLSCCINALNFCVHYLCLIGWVHVFYVGHVDRIDYIKPFSIL
jgi:hypothetical protein